MISDFDPIAFTPNRAMAADGQHWYWNGEEVKHPILKFWQRTVRGTDASDTFDPALGIIAGQISNQIARRLLWGRLLWVL